MGTKFKDTLLGLSIQNFWYNQQYKAGIRTHGTFSKPNSGFKRNRRKELKLSAKRKHEH